MSQSRRILIIDDDRDILESLSTFLQFEGYEVLTAEGGPQAVDLVAEGNFRPDLVILDLMMPVLDGFSTFMSLNSHFESTVPFLFVTATTLRIKEKGLENVPHDTLHKPLDFDLLRQRVRELIAQTS